MEFRTSNIKIFVGVTSGVVLLTYWMDLDTMFVVQLREIARVLGLQGAPAEPDINPVRSSIQGILSDFPVIFKDFSLIFVDFSEI